MKRFLLGCVILVCSACTALAEESEPINITADSIEMSQDQTVLNLDGNVQIRSGENVLYLIGAKVTTDSHGNMVIEAEEISEVPH